MSRRRLTDVEKTLKRELKIRYNFLRLLDNKIDKQFLEKELKIFIGKHYGSTK